MLENGVCVKCGQSCVHSFADSICTACGFSCPVHSWTDGVCSICGLRCTHSYANGFCSVCGIYQAAAWNEEESVYEISNAGQLYWYAQLLNEDNADMTVVLTNDIVIPEKPPNGIPITASYVTFNGNYHTISGLKCIGGDMTYVGLFGNEGWWYVIENLGIVNSYFEGGQYAGALIGCFGNGGSATNCYVANTVVKGADYNQGGLVGYLNSNLYNCFSTATDGESPLPLVGYSASSYYATIENCYYLSEAETEDGGKTADQFASGEVAYLLQSGVSEEGYYDESDEWVSFIPEIWGQTIVTGESYGVEVNNAASITGGDVTIKAVCNHGSEQDDGDCTTAVLCPDCNLELIPAKAHVDSDNNHRCDTCGKLMQPAKICFATASMEGNIAINFYTLLSDEVIADPNAYMQFIMVDGEVIRIPVSQAVHGVVNGETYYVFTCKVNAKEMADDVICQFFYEGGSSTEITYNVMKYGNYIVENFTVTCNGQALEVKQRSGLYYVDVVGIAAKDLDETVNLTINDGTTTAEVFFNPMSYCQGVLNDNSGSFDQEMKDLVAALYLYNQAANNYFKEG